MSLAVVPGWVEHAACGDADPVMFDTDVPDRWREGLALCGGCPVRRQCLAYALDQEPRDSARAMIYGGLTPRQRSRAARGRPVGRPTGATRDAVTSPPEPVPDVCRGCGRRLRAQRVPAEDAPGTVRHAGRGLCQMCWRADAGYAWTAEGYRKQVAS